MDFRDWPINPNWRLFQGARGANSGADSSKEIDKNVWKREILCVKQFMDFYLKDVAASRENVALEKPESLAFRPSEARGTISDEVLEWMLRTLPNLPISPHRVRIIAMYLTVARHSVRPMWQVVGGTLGPGRVDQFSRSAQDIWLENHPKTGNPVPLPPTFGRAFDRYLTYLNIDARQPLPASNLFPREDSVGAYDLKGLSRIMCSIRESLADMAKTSDTPNIAQAADDIRRLTAAMVSTPSLGKS